MDSINKVLEDTITEIEVLESKQVELQNSMLSSDISPIMGISEHIRSQLSIINNGLYPLHEIVENISEYRQLVDTILEDSLSPLLEYVESMNIQIQAINEILNTVKIYSDDIGEKFKKLMERAEILSPDLLECSILYYITVGYKYNTCNSVEDICNLIQSQIDKGNELDFSLTSLTKDYDKLCDFDKLHYVFVDYYSENGCEYNFDNLVELLNNINKYCDIQDELDVLIKCKNLSSDIIIVNIVNLLERLCTKLINNNWGEIGWRESDEINADDAIKAIISTVCLNVTYKEYMGKISIPNRHAIVHHSVTCCNNYDDVCNILIDMVYKIIYCKYMQYIKRNTK